MIGSNAHAFGLQQEELIQPILSDAFDCELVKTSGMYNPFDFENTEKKYLIEVKSRHNRRTQYPTTMIGYHKVKCAVEAISRGYSVFYIFNFTDAVCYYQITDVIPEWQVGRNYMIPIGELGEILDEAL
jgi:hypothetical protein